VVEFLLDLSICTQCERGGEEVTQPDHSRQLYDQFLEVFAAYPVLCYFCSQLHPPPYPVPVRSSICCTHQLHAPSCSLVKMG
jgi:hypothetical protein